MVRWGEGIAHRCLVGWYRLVGWFTGSIKLVQCMSKFAVLSMIMPRRLDSERYQSIECYCKYLSWILFLSTAAVPILVIFIYLYMYTVFYSFHACAHSFVFIF